MTTDAFEKAVRTIRFLSVDGVEQANSGHPGTPMALAGITVDLFTKHLRYNPKDPAWPNRDRFVLSCGHASMLLYSTLHLAGYAVSRQDLMDFRQWGSSTPGHPEVGDTPGVEITTGPLGSGVSSAVGMAMASKMLGARFSEGGAPLIDYRVFALASDGDIMEGVASEASSLAGHLELDNLVVIYDANDITIDGDTAQTFREDVGKRYEAYGWFVQHVDGHAPEEVRAALDKAVAETKRPSMIVAKTHIAIGAPTKQDTAGAHGAPLGAKEVEETKRLAEWPQDPFSVPPGADEVFLKRAEENAPLYASWHGRFEALGADARTAWDAFHARPEAKTLLSALLEAVPPAKDATRGLSAKVEQVVAARVPALVGGSADLAASCKTTIKGAADIAPGEFGGRNIHYGIREHAMGAISNGLALSGFLPLTSTFLIFSDYMRPSIRLAALMKQQVAFVFTHDSVLLGEDGPTHQPVEQMWSLRLIPNLDVIRPADALECCAAWAATAAKTNGPTALILSRQSVPEIPREAGFDPQSMLNGAYVLKSVAGDAEYVIVATGSEVHAAIDAAKALDAKGHPTRVVSMPCVERFLALPDDEQDAIFGEGRRVSFEAGRTGPWTSVVGRKSLRIGVDRFGASAPDSRLAEEFGLTAAKVVEAILATRD